MHGVSALYKLMSLFPRSVMLKAVLAATVASSDGSAALFRWEGGVLGSNQVVFSVTAPVNIHQGLK